MSEYVRATDWRREGPPVTGELLTTREVAGLLGLSPESVLRKWRRGELPGYRLASNVLRFSAADVDRYLQGCRRERVEERQA